jgi:hypothetical protein
VAAVVLVAAALAAGAAFLAGGAFLAGAVLLAAAFFVAAAFLVGADFVVVAAGADFLAGAALAAAVFLAGAAGVAFLAGAAGVAFLAAGPEAPFAAAVRFDGAAEPPPRPALACLPFALVAASDLAFAVTRAGPALAADAFVEVAALRAAGRADAAATTVLRAGVAATTAFRVAAEDFDAAGVGIVLDGRAGFFEVEAVFAVDAAGAAFDAFLVLPAGPETALTPAPEAAFVLVGRAATAPDFVAAGGAAFARSAMASPICKTGAQRARCALRRLARIRNVRTDDNTAHRSSLVGALTSL